MQTEQITDRRLESNELINELVNNRKEVLTLYTELASQQPFKSHDEIMGLVETFCQSLIDYTASAHFRLYRFIDERKERRQTVLDVANDVYPAIVDTTRAILDFNDKYEHDLEHAPLKALEGDLSHLGEKLADRIELEDAVIEVMTKSK